MFRRLSRLKLGPDRLTGGAGRLAKRMGKVQRSQGSKGERYGNTKGREREGPIRRMKRRLVRWKECRRTSAGGQPRARLLSRIQKALSPRLSLPSRYKREYPVSLPCLDLSLPSLAHRARSSHCRRRRSIALRSLLATYGRMSEST